MFWLLFMRYPGDESVDQFFGRGTTWNITQRFLKLRDGHRRRRDPKMTLVSQLYPRFAKKDHFEVQKSRNTCESTKKGVFARLQVPGT